MSFREPEDWEKALVGLEAGKWTGEMESKVFRRFCKKGKKNVEGFFFLFFFFFFLFFFFFFFSLSLFPKWRALCISLNLSPFF